MDEFLEHVWLNKARWEVVLNNGETIYQDDGRPGLDPSSAWIRLYNRCVNEGLYIIEMRFGFRNNMKSLPSNMDGYYFSHGAVGALGNTRSFSFFMVGFLDNGILRVTQWKTPEMLENHTEIRNVEQAGQCLITKSMCQSTEQPEV